LIWPRHPDDDSGDDEPLRVLTEVSSGSGPVCDRTRNNPGSRRRSCGGLPSRSADGSGSPRPWQ
jgi:hypothetical protein